MEATKEFIVTSLGEEGYVEVKESDTLIEVRSLILDEFDEEQLPADEFTFKVNGIRISSKQEGRKLAFDLLMKQAKVELVPRSIPKRKAESPLEEPEKTHKRFKTSSLVTPTESSFNEKEEQQCESSDKPSPLVLDQKLVDENELQALSNANEMPRQDENENNHNHNDEIMQPLDDDSSDEENMESTVKISSNDSSEYGGNESDAKENPHKEADEAQQKSNQVLDQLKAILLNNPLFCTESRRQDWLKEIQDLQERSTPQTVFGVLGNTGVGKSSLLNALLEEAAVLPTSGSRGCTAAVVELVFHTGLLKADIASNNEINNLSMIPVYQGEVQFITLQDWLKELKILVEECSTAEKTVYALVPDEDKAPTAAAAWQKIEQVYGKGYMRQFHKLPTQLALNRLASNPRVKNLLTATTPGKEYNSVNVNIGEVTPGSEEAMELLKPFDQMKARTKRKKKQWAQDFRKEINSYVYRMGNGDQPQTWPLIRKVQLRGPWSVLSTGAVLVDLPGVRDSNAARAKVAERYLQNCNQIAIVAPIKRAVDDGTAKELLGEQFKRRLLMDGQYGNVFFICTQTDDLEATETMRDHADVAQREPGRWERMSELATSLTDLEKELNDRLLEEEDLDAEIQEAEQQYNESKDDLDEVLKDNDDESDIEIDEELLQNLRNVVKANKATFQQARQALQKFRADNQQAIDRDQAKCSKMQKELKTMCAAVRNEYSKSCLQEDFRSGLKELYRKDDENDGSSNEDADIALPEEFNMDVFCISSNDYLKLMKIKPSRDGPPNTFFNPVDTQIPQLRAFVHETTSRLCKSHSKTFVENTNDLLDRMKLLTTDGSDNSTGKSAQRMKSNFESEMKKLNPKIQAIADNFKKVLDEKIKKTLTKSLHNGVKKGSAEAMNTVHSWGSSNRRTAHERRPDKNGLHHLTYNAVVRRNGVYTSGSAGEIDFNQELCDPMEKEFSTDWQSVLDSTIRRMLNEIERGILQLCADVSQSLASNFRASGVDASRLTIMVNTANRSAISALKVLFQQMGVVAVDAQRELSRTLLPAVQSQMLSTYQSVLHVEGGAGKYMRMKDAMTSNAQRVVNRMFDNAMKNLLAGIQSVVQRLHAMIASAAVVICKTMESVFAICWDDQSGKSNLIDPEMLKKIRACRDALLPELNRLCVVQASASELMGIEREEMELDLMAVETFDQMLERRLDEAKKNGDVIDLCDSDAEDDFLSAPPTFARMRVKTEEYSM